MGVAGTTLTKPMSTTPQLNQGQRQAFEKTLYESLRKAERDHERKEAEARTTALLKLAEEKGATELAKQVMQLEAQLEDSNSGLESLGFRIRNSQIELGYDVPDELKQAYEKLVNEQTANERSKVEAITAAITRAWQVSSLDEAKKVVQAFA